MSTFRDLLNKLLGRTNRQNSSNEHVGPIPNRPRIILPLYVYEPGVEQLTYEANQGIPTSSTRSESRTREGTGKIQVSSFGVGATANNQENVSQESHHSPAVMLSDTRKKLVDTGQLKISPTFNEVEIGDMVEITGVIRGADIGTQTQGIMEAGKLASEIIKTIPANRRPAQSRKGIRVTDAQSVLDVLAKSRGENPEGHLILESQEGYRVRLDTDRDCFLRAINEHYVVSAIGIVKKKLESEDDPLPLMPQNVKPIYPLMEQLDQLWENVYENQPLVKELEGPCLIVIPVCIH